MKRLKSLICCLSLVATTAGAQLGIELDGSSPLYCRSGSYDNSVSREWHRLNLSQLPAVGVVTGKQAHWKKYRWLKNLWRSAASQDAGLINDPALTTGDTGPASPQWAGNDRLCGRSHHVASLISPRTVLENGEVKVLFASDKSLKNVTVLVTDLPEARVGLCGIDLEYNKFVVPSVVRSSHSVPNWLVARFNVGQSRAFQVSLVKKGRIVHCETLHVKSKVRKRRRTTGVWLTERDWSKHQENLFSAWLEHMFSSWDDAFWDALHDVTRDSNRNLLHNHLGQNEDRPKGYKALNLTPDCADNPLYLRAYFSWKMGLPFGYHSCGMAGRGKAADCSPRVEMRHILVRLRKSASEKKVLRAQSRIAEIRNSIVD